MTSTFGMGGFEFFPEQNVLMYVGEEDLVLDKLEVRGIVKIFSRMFVADFV